MLYFWASSYNEHKIFTNFSQLRLCRYLALFGSTYAKSGPFHKLDLAYLLRVVRPLLHGCSVLG